ncbi:hypothetical protein AN958_06662 [Leucoagaricus sp. SymC.cos]|nr:hypothetical protein AN958_06662 [Leucoagaricus sp. SymC.cos]
MRSRIYGTGQTMNNSFQWLPLRSTDDRSSMLRPYTRSMDATTARSSFDHPLSAKRNPSGLSHLKQSGLPTRSLTALSTPHDQILEKLYHHPGRSESALPLPSELDADPLLARDSSQTGDAHHMNPVDTNTYQNTKSRSLNEPANFRDGAVSATPTASFASNLFPATRLYDPFDGSPLGIIAPAESAGRDGEDMSISGGSSNEELWSHLSRVLDLQNQIARMHVDMEGVGLGKQADGKGKAPFGISSRPTGFTRPRTTSTSSVPGGEVGDEEGVGSVDEESEKLKDREREFKKLATQFEGRKEAINEVMGKVRTLVLCSGIHLIFTPFVSQLDDLSRALTEFHSLQVPKIEFPSSSRNNSLGTNSSNHVRIPVVIPPSDTASPASAGEWGSQPSNLSMRVPAPYLHPSRHDGRSNLSPNPAASTQLLTKSLDRKGPVPTLIINSIEPGSQTHVVDSPVSTSSLKLTHEEDTG